MASPDLVQPLKGVLDDLTVIDRDRVERFLRDSPNVRFILRDAAAEIRRQFPDSRLLIRIADDPEQVDHAQLALDVQTAHSPREALSRLDEFNESWWLDNLDRAEGKLCVDVVPQ